MPKALQAWRADLQAKGKSKTADLLADPSKDEERELFAEHLREALAREEAILGASTKGIA